MSINIHKINNENLFYPEPVKPGDQTTLLCYKDKKNSIKHNKTISCIDLMSRYEHIATLVESKEKLDFNPSQTIDWFNVEGFVYKEPILNNSKISKHFRKVIPGEFDYCCSPPSEYTFFSNQFSEDSIFFCSRKVAMFLGVEYKSLRDQDIKTIIFNMGYLTDREKKTVFLSCKQNFEKIKVPYYRFLAEEKIYEFNSLEYNDKVNSRIIHSNASLKLFESWIPHKGNLYVSKNRKVL